MDHPLSGGVERLRVIGGVDGSLGGDEEVEVGEGYQIGAHFVQVHVQSAIVPGRTVECGGVVWWWCGMVVVWYGGGVVWWWCGMVVVWYGGGVVWWWCGMVVVQDSCIMN